MKVPGLGTLGKNSEVLTWVPSLFDRPPKKFPPISSRGTNFPPVSPRRALQGHR
jgi:hypothetical protein